MNTRQFRTLYRQFLFRVVDLELVAPAGDLQKLLGQIAAALIFLSVGFSIGIVGLGNARMAPARLAVAAWGLQHALISTTMLVVGIFSVLSWDSHFPDRRDALALGPLPVSGPTLFAAKAAAGASALGLTVAALNALPGLLLALALAPPAGSMLELLFQPAFFRGLAAYWVTMTAAGAFIFGAVVGLQGLASHVLPRTVFLRLSAVLQVGGFCLFCCVYFLEPRLANPESLAAPENREALIWLPSYWFLALFQELNGSSRPALDWLAARAWSGTGVMAALSMAAYGSAFVRTIRRAADVPDIPPNRRWFSIPSPLRGLDSAILRFSVRTLLRSRQHRMTLAFYVGLAFAGVILVTRSGAAEVNRLTSDRETALLFASLLGLCVWVAGLRVVFSIPHALRGNRIFRLTETNIPQRYLAAIRRAFLALTVAPVVFVNAAVFAAVWPLPRSIAHLTVLGLCGLVGAYACLYRFHKIPFACSYLPGKSQVHMRALGAIGFVVLIGKLAEAELRVLSDIRGYLLLTAVLVSAALLASCRASAAAASEDAAVELDDLETPTLVTLNLPQPEERTAEGRRSDTQPCR